MSASDDVWHAVDEITRPNRKRLIRDDGTVIWVEEPSLWDQLAESIADLNSQGASHGVPASRPPLSLEIAEWRRNVEDLTADALSGHEKKMRETIPDSLRLLSSTVVSTTDQDLIEEWAKTFRRWVRQARTLLGQVVLPRAIRGVSCPSCEASYAQVDTPDGKVRRPALSIVFNENLVRNAECLACEKTWFRGRELRLLARILGGPDLGEDDELLVD